MKLHMPERILAAVLGLCLIVTGFFTAIWCFGWLSDGYIASLRANGFFVVLLALVWIALGVMGVAVLVCPRKGRKRFLLQPTELGDVSLSVDAVESLAVKCITDHEELRPVGVDVYHDDDGLIVTLRISIAGGVKVLPVVESLQKNIRLYVTECTGMSVHEVRIQVEPGDQDGAQSPFAVETPPVVIEKEIVEPVAETEAAAPMQDEPAQEEEAKTEEKEMPADEAL